MQVAKCDTKGRLYLREAIREKYGQKFMIVQAPDELVLIPLPKDPIADLREVASKIRGVSLKKLKELIQEEAKKQVCT